MGTHVDISPTSPSQGIDLNSEVIWNKLYPSLRSLSRYLVYSFRVSLWQGQEEDLIEDIVQETAWRIIERARKAERGEADPIYSLKHMMTVIAQNYCRDLRRSDRRMFHFPPQDDTTETLPSTQEQTHAFDAVIESVYQECILTKVARNIANFPEKQREAILIDLANHMSFDGHPTPLQRAFLELGIQLEQYRLPLPLDQRERGRYLSLRTLAYKRVARLNLQEYDSIE
jgi:DNA-directed RNA polymerase specialized sigma24 family protein